MQGSTVSDDQIFAVIDCLLRQQRLPYSADAVYAFLAASNVYNPGVDAEDGAAQTGCPTACMHARYWTHAARLLPHADFRARWPDGAPPGAISCKRP
jgi:hypothetical protein